MMLPQRSCLFAVMVWSCLVPTTRADLLVCSRDTNHVLRYDEKSGAFLGVFTKEGGDLRRPAAMAFGLEGDLYVNSNSAHLVLRYDGQTGDYVGALEAPEDLGRTSGLALGPDGNFYVSSVSTGRIVRFNALTGAYLGIFASVGVISRPNMGMVFGPDNFLYAANVETIRRFNPVTGQSSTFVGVGRFDSPGAITFGPDGNLYVSDNHRDRVLRFNGVTGAFMDVFVEEGAGGLGRPTGLVFGPDGNLYVSSRGTDEILRFDGQTGAFLDVFVTEGNGGLSAPTYLLFTPPP